MSAIGAYYELVASHCSAPAQLPVPSGSTSPGLLPFHALWQRPTVIADANALIQDVIRRSRNRFSLMPLLAQYRLINLLTAEHVDAKVYEHLPRACQNAHADPSIATKIYETQYRPLLRLVAVGDLMADDERVRAVALVDEEDVPIAQLGVLLAPSLVLTQDAHLLAAGIGVKAWADALVLIKRLVELHMSMWGAAHGLALPGVLAVHGIAKLVRLLERSEVALGIALLVILFRHQLKNALTWLKEAGALAFERALSLLALTFERRDDIQSQLRTTLVPPHESEALEVAIAQLLLQHDQPVGAAAIHAALPYSSRRLELDELMRVLRLQPAFRLVPGRGWTLGQMAEHEARRTG